MRTKSGLLFSVLTFLSICVFSFSISADTSPYSVSNGSSGGDGGESGSHTPWATKLAANERFEVVLDGLAVIDNETGLIWERYPGRVNQNVIQETVDWYEAQHACRARSVGGRMGWKLPTAPQLASLLDEADGPGPELNLPFGHPFVNFTSGDGGGAGFWTSTPVPHEDYPDVAYNIFFKWGFLSNTTKDSRYGVWCVRDGM